MAAEARTSKATVQTGQGRGHIPFILASQSPSRQALLVKGGISPVIRKSHLDEPKTLEDAAQAQGLRVADLSIEDRVSILAEGKADLILQTLRAVIDAETQAQGDLVVVRPLDARAEDPAQVEPMHQAVRSWAGMVRAKVGPLLLGCDSLFSLDGRIMGKPHTPEVAMERLMAMRGRTGTLVTGHCLTDVASGRRVRAVSRAEVSFGQYDRDDMEAYIATGEPLEVAGSFTLEGLGSAFITGIEGDPSGVMGLSMPTLRSLVGQLGLHWADLWDPALVRPADSEDRTDPSGIVPPKGNVHQPGDGWVNCACGKQHWGLNGAAGVLLARRDQQTGVLTEVLLQHRARWSAEGGTWGVPGGAVSDGESPLEGGLRESYEEANVHPEDIQVVGSHLEDHGPWGYTTILAFERPGHRVDPHMNDDESIELAWVPIDQVDSRPLLGAFGQDWPHFRRRLEDLAARD